MVEEVLGTPLEERRHRERVEWDEQYELVIATLAVEQRDEREDDGEADDGRKQRRGRERWKDEPTGGGRPPAGERGRDGEAGEGPQRRQLASHCDGGSHHTHPRPSLPPVAGIAERRPEYRDRSER